MAQETRKAHTDSLEELLSPHAGHAEEDLSRLLVEDDVPEALAQAMRYCVLGGGKRLRPALVSMACQAVGGDCRAELCRRAGAAIELIHCYSLVHDDLPAMDDDVLRRGRPTAHVQFGQAMAILAGDALLTRAFGILGEAGAGPVAALSAELARGAGAAGMIAGQVADMDLCTIPPGVEGLSYIHARKTAALIRSAARMGAICGGASAQQLESITQYAQALGLAFQLIDDLLDVSGSAQDLGKTPGKDAAAGKRTHVAIIGLEASQQLAASLTGRAIDAAKPLGERGSDLLALATLLSQRTR